jgi:hypothetical protein
MTSGDLMIEGLTTLLALAMNGSSCSPSLSIFKPKAHLAITSMVNELNTLEINQSSLLGSHWKLIESNYSLAFAFPVSTALCSSLSASKSAHSLISSDICATVSLL